jgi:DNA replication protein DnaC
MNQQTCEQLKELRLPAMAQAYRLQGELNACENLGFDERLALLVQAEWDSRKDKKLKRLLSAAALRQAGACLEQLDFSDERGLSREAVARLADCRWVRQGRNLLLSGACGTGKTYLACAFGNAACRSGFSVRFVRVPRLLTDLYLGRGDGSYQKILAALKKQDLLILDDFGLAPLEAMQCRDLLEVIDDRHGSGSIIVSSQLPVASWHAVFADATIADAVMDRLLQAAHRFELSGPSRRLSTVCEGEE